MFIQIPLRKGQVDRVSVPYDERDPFIFHSIGNVPFELGVRAIKENASLAPLEKTHKLTRLKATPFAPLKTAEAAALIAAWERAGSKSRGYVEKIDFLAGDGKYVFMTPGYPYSLYYPTAAFRYSTLKAHGSVLLRCRDAQEHYVFAARSIAEKSGIPFTDYDAKRAMDLVTNKNNPEYAELLHALKVIRELYTLSADESQIVIPAYVRSFSTKIPLSDRAQSVIRQKMTQLDSLKSLLPQQTYGRLAESLSTRMRARWAEYFSDLVNVYPEVLFDGIIPLRASEFLFDPATKGWQTTNSISGQALSGLGRSFLKTGRQILISGWRVR
jgi:hypothetical protein